MKIKVKIIIIVALVLIIFNSAFAFFTIMSQRKQASLNLEKKMQSTNKLLKETLSDAVWQFNSENTENAINTYVEDSEIAFISLEDLSGKIIYKAGLTDYEQLTNKEIQKIKLGKKGRHLGNVIIVYTSETNQQEIKHFKEKVIYETIGQIILTAVAIFFLVGIIIKPFNYLLEGLKQVNQGNLNYRIEVKTKDEFDILSKAFNSMSTNLKNITASRDELNKEIAIRKKTEDELRDALENVKVLKGYLPICSSCKKIRNDDGYWQQVEEFVTKHSDAEFSHTLCNSCLEKMYPEMYDEMKRENKLS